MTESSHYTLEKLGQVIHDRVNDKFIDRPMPTESVSENFIHQIVLSVLKELREEGSIPFIPEFKILNKTSMEERFSDNIPDFSKHINLVGLDKERPPDEFGVMNVAFDGEDAERYQNEIEQSDTQNESRKDREMSAEEDSSKSSQESSGDGSESNVEIPDYLTVIEGGKSSS